MDRPHGEAAGGESIIVRASIRNLLISIDRDLRIWSTPSQKSAKNSQPMAHLISMAANDLPHRSTSWRSFGAGLRAVRRVIAFLPGRQRGNS
jgi:hypothetical protein